MVYRFLLLCAFMLAGCATTYQPSSVEADLPAAAKINLQLGMTYLANGNSERAKQKLLLAKQQSPKDPMVYDALGYFYERTGDLDAADNQYRHALQIAPKMGATNNNYGTFFCRQGHYQQAITYFMLVTTDPNYLSIAAVYQNAGQCALKIPDKKLAKQYFQQAKAAAG